MSGKDLSKIKLPGAASAAGTAVKESIARSGSRSAPPAGEAEQFYRAQTMTTQGRKGCKQKRINMAFTPANYSFVQIMSKAHGVTMTKFVNNVLDEYREAHPDAYQQLQKVIDDLEK